MLGGLKAAGAGAEVGQALVRTNEPSSGSVSSVLRIHTYLFLGAVFHALWHFCSRCERGRQNPAIECLD